MLDLSLHPAAALEARARTPVAVQEVVKEVHVPVPASEVEMLSEIARQVKLRKSGAGDEVRRLLCTCNP